MSEKTADKDDSAMSPEERLAWLRERGVLVETSDDRKRAQVAAAMRQAEQLEEQQQDISYVLVPPDTSRPLEELTFRPSFQKTGDQLLDHVKPAFAKTTSENIDLDLLREQQQQQQQTLLGSVSDNVVPEVSDATLLQVAQEAHVESFRLVHPIPSNNFTAIHMYLDEIGSLKRLPLNTRATEYAKLAGFNPPPVFYGDVYLGRVQQKPHIQHLPFRLGIDTALDAPWLQAAMTQNLEYQMEQNRITGNKEQQPAIAGSDGKAKQEEGYQWTQTEQELEVMVPLPSDAKSKDVSIKFLPQKLVVKMQQEPKVSLELFERVDVDGCTWTIESGTDDSKKLIITMEKQEEAFWPRIRD